MTASANGDYYSRKELTPRMVQIITEILSGNCTNKGIAKALGISEYTVKNIVHIIMCRYRVENRTHLVLKYRLGVLSKIVPTLVERNDTRTTKKSS